jgi:DNA processing protein
VAVNKEEMKYWVGFSLILGIRRVRSTQLENYFNNLENAWKATPAELKQSGPDNGSIRAVTSRRPKISLEARMERLDRYKVKVE